MADGDYLQPPAEGEKPSQMWEMTWRRIDRFLPNLFRDIYPESKVTTGGLPEATPQKTATEVELSNSKTDDPGEVNSDGKSEESETS